MENAQYYIDRGYRRVSNKFRTISRVDRADWKEFMARNHSPWSLKEGMGWVKCLGEGAADFYRRCLSKDIISVPETVFKQIPGSGWDTTGYIEIID